MGGNLEDPRNHYHSTCTRKSSSNCAEDQPSLINSVHLCLIVMNTILTVIHALKPSSLTHTFYKFIVPGSLVQDPIHLGFGLQNVSLQLVIGGNLGDSGNHYHSTCTRKSSSDCAEDQSFLINSVHLCLIVMNTILTVIHAQKPSSLTHFLQIYCTGFIGPRSHTS